MAYNLNQVEPEEPTGLYADPRAPEEAPHSGRLLRIAGALVVMGGFAGGLWFAHTQGLHHAGVVANPGEIPLVRADTSPFKVKPQNPGGMQLPDRAMLIYGEQHQQIEHLLPPPEQPMARPMPPPPPPKAASRAAPLSSPGPPREQAVRRAVPTPSTLEPAGQPVSHPALGSPSPVAEQATAHSTLPSPSSLPEQSVPPSALPPSPSGLQEPQPEAPGATSTTPVMAPQAATPSGSPPPAAKSRPELDIIGQKIEQLEAAATANRVKRNETGRAGGLRLQLGALRSESEARSTWERLKRSNADLLGKLTAATVRADLGDKGIYYRIEAGPVGEPAAASRVCSELRQRHLACMIIR